MSRDFNFEAEIAPRIEKIIGFDPMGSTYVSVITALVEEFDKLKEQNDKLDAAYRRALQREELK